MLLAFGTPFVAIATTLVMRNRRPLPPRFGLALSLFGLLLLPQMLQRADEVHTAYWCVLMVPIAFALMQDVPLVRYALIVYACVMLAGPIRQEWPFTMKETLALRSDTLFSGVDGIEHNGRWLPMGPATSVAGLTDTLTALGRIARPGDRVLVGPSDLRYAYMLDTSVYHLIPQYTAGFYLEADPGLYNRVGSRLESDVRAADFAIINSKMIKSREENTSSQPGWDAPQKITGHSVQAGDGIERLAIAAAGFAQGFCRLILPAESIRTCKP